MGSIFYKNYREFVSNKFNLVVLFLPSLIYIALGLRDGSFNLEFTFLSIVNLSIFELIFYIPKTFSLEKDNRTFETLISTPLLFKNVLMSTLLFYVVCINIPILMYFILSTIYILVMGLSLNIIYSMSIILLMSTIVCVNMTLAGLIVSVKSENVIACSMKVVYVLVAYFLPFTIALSIMEGGGGNNLIIIVAYIIVSLVIFFITYAKAKTLFNKPELLKTYTKGV